MTHNITNASHTVTRTIRLSSDSQIALRLVDPDHLEDASDYRLGDPDPVNPLSTPINDTDGAALSNPDFSPLTLDDINLPGVCQRSGTYEFSNYYADGFVSLTAQGNNFILGLVEPNYEPEQGVLPTLLSTFLSPLNHGATPDDIDVFGRTESSWKLNTDVIVGVNGSREFSFQRFIDSDPGSVFDLTPAGLGVITVYEAPFVTFVSNEIRQSYCSSQGEVINESSPQFIAGVLQGDAIGFSVVNLLGRSNVYRTNPAEESSLRVDPPSGDFIIQVKRPDQDEYSVVDEGRDIYSAANFGINPRFIYGKYASIVAEVAVVLDTLEVRLTYLSTLAEDPVYNGSDMTRPFCRGRGSVEFNVLRSPSSPVLVHSTRVNAETGVLHGSGNGLFCEDVPGTADAFRQQVILEVMGGAVESTTYEWTNQDGTGVGDLYSIQVDLPRLANNVPSGDNSINYVYSAQATRYQTETFVGCRSEEASIPITIVGLPELAIPESVIIGDDPTALSASRVNFNLTEQASKGSAGVCVGTIGDGGDQIEHRNALINLTILTPKVFPSSSSSAVIDVVDQVDGVEGSTTRIDNIESLSATTPNKGIINADVQRGRPGALTGSINADLIQFNPFEYAKDLDPNLGTIEAFSQKDVSPTIRYTYTNTYIDPVVATRTVSCASSVEITMTINPLPEVDFTYSDVSLRDIDGNFPDEVFICSDRSPFDIESTLVQNQLGPGGASFTISTESGNVRLAGRRIRGFSPQDNDFRPNNGIKCPPGESRNCNRFTPSTEHLLVHQVQDINLCRNFATKTIKIYPIPSIQLSASNLCEDVGSAFEVELGNSDSFSSGSTLEYLWKFDEEASAVRPRSVTQEFSNTGAHNVAVTASAAFSGTGELSCSTSSDRDIQIGITPLPVLAWTSAVVGTPTKFLLYEGNLLLSQLRDLELSVAVSNEKATAIAKRTSPEPLLEDITYTFTEAGSYELSLEAASIAGCSFTFDIPINVVPHIQVAENNLIYHQL